VDMEQRWDGEPAKTPYCGMRASPLGTTVVSGARSAPDAGGSIPSDGMSGEGFAPVRGNISTSTAAGKS
jgi:hypothetical protein